MELHAIVQRMKKTYDAARTKEIILDAAEEMFAEHGYSATRVDAIASLAGYNKSLIYQYFGDKLGLYTGVIKRADQLGNTVFESLAGGSLADETTTSDPSKFRRLLGDVIRSSYQFLLDHPRYLKIYLWEAAEEWKIWKSISYSPDDIIVFSRLAESAKKNGLIRKDIEPIMMPILLMNLVIPFVQTYRRLSEMMPDEIQSQIPLEQFKEQLVHIVVYGLMEPSLL
jgi:AcrR family transcriptional regulator